MVLKASGAGSQDLRICCVTVGGVAGFADLLAPAEVQCSGLAHKDCRDAHVHRHQGSQIERSYWHEEGRLWDVCGLLNSKQKSLLAVGQ